MAGSPAVVSSPAPGHCVGRWFRRQS